MGRKVEYDHIDIELSKTYFGPIPAKKTVEKKSPEISRFKTVSLASIAFLLLVSLGIFIFQNKKIFFSVVDTSSRIHKTKTIALDIPSGSVPSGFTGTANVVWDFEKNESGWEIPSWTMEKADHVCRSLSKASGLASNGKGSLELQVDFPGGRWTAAYIEIIEYINLNQYDILLADIFLPPSCPSGLRAKFILTVGEDWQFVEMSRTIPLVPGKWTTLSADLTPASRDWRRKTVDEAFKGDVRKLGIRIESDRTPAYNGPLYVDAVRFGKFVKIEEQVPPAPNTEPSETTNNQGIPLEGQAKPEQTPTNTEQ